MSNQITGAEIFSAGTWNGMNFTERDLDNIVHAFDALSDAGKVPLKFGHNDKQDITDGQPALGWVTRVWRSGKKLFADFSDIPTVVFDAIRKKLYKQVSIELLPEVSRNGASFPWVLDAVALLGADKPAVKELSDLNTLLMIRQIPGIRFGQRAAFTLGNHIGERAIMTDEEIKKLQSDNEALRKQNAEIQSQMEADKKARFAEKVAEHRKAVTAKLNAAVEEGRIFGRTRDRIQNSRLFKDDQEVLTAYSLEAVDAEIKQDQRADFKEKKGPTSHATGDKDDAGLIGKPVADVVYFRARTECVKLGGKADNIDDMAAATGRVLTADKTLAELYYSDQNAPYQPASA